MQIVARKEGGVKMQMIGKIKKALAPFKKAFIIAAVCIVLYIVFGVGMPIINEVLANKTPIVSIEATNDKEYSVTDEIKPEDFSVRAIHENGRKTHIGNSEIEISTKNIKPVGKSTKVTLVMKNDESIKCEVKVKTKRKKIVSFTCGYPNIKDVKAVIYSNGELCFEGVGDIMTFDEGEMPWSDYEEMDEYPIRAVSFEDGVTPANLNYCFEGLPELTYIDTLPSTTQSMVRTFSGCPKLTKTGDWSKCSVLLNITECYSNDTELLEISPIPENVRTAVSAFMGCTKLMDPPNFDNALSLVNCTQTFSGCKSLGSATLPPNIVIAQSMFEGCINLKDVPVMPNTIQDISGMFRGNISLVHANVIPESVTKISDCFSGCEFLSGEVVINCNAQEYGGMFTGACIATKINLVGDSYMLDVYANTKEDNVSNIYVNSRRADASIKSYEDILRKLQEEAEADVQEQNQGESDSTEELDSNQEADDEGDSEDEESSEEDE